MLSVRDGDTGAQPAADLALPPHLQHGAILEDVLLVTHHAVLIESWDPLLRILHDLRGRMEGQTWSLGASSRQWDGDEWNSGLRGG